MKTISFANQKGGIGKTTSAVATAALLQQRGFNVLLVDLDPQGNATSMSLGEKPSPAEDQDITSVLQGKAGLVDIVEESPFGFGVAPASKHLNRIELGGLAEFRPVLAEEIGKYNDLLREHVSTELDFTLMDTKPGAGTLLLHALTTSDEIIIPVLIEPLSAEGLGDFLEVLKDFSDEVGVRPSLLGILPCMVDYRRGARTPRNLEQLQAAVGEKLFPETCYVPENSEMTDVRTTGELPSSGNPAIRAYENMVDEVLRRLGIATVPA